MEYDHEPTLFSAQDIRVGMKWKQARNQIRKPSADSAVKNSRELKGLRNFNTRQDAFLHKVKKEADQRKSTIAKDEQSPENMQ